MPESSVLVYEYGKCEPCVQATAQSVIWKLIQKAAFYSRESDSLKDIFDFLTSAQYNLVSMHVTKKDDFDFVFYSRAIVKDLVPTVTQWRKNKQFRFSEREFNAVKIQELNYKSHVFSWIVIDNTWIGSFTPFLIEDVIRTYQSDNQKTFRNTVADVYQLPKMKKDAGNLYIHFKNFSDWLNIFTNQKNASFLRNIAKSSVLDIKTNGHHFILNGFSSDSINKSEFLLSVFTGQSPVPFNLKNLVSNRTAYATSYGVSDGNNFARDLLDLRLRPSSYNDTLEKVCAMYKLEKDFFYKNIKGEIGLCFVESKGRGLSKMLLISTNGIDAWINKLNTIAVKSSIDTVFYERYGDYEIHEIALYRFPEKLYAPLISGFDRSYYTSLGNVILISEDLEELKNYLDDIDRDETWGKSVSQNKFLESTLLESNVSLFVNTERVWNVVSGVLTDRWQKFINENQSMLGSVDMGAIQFSHLNETFYTNVTWSYHSPDEKKLKNTVDDNRKITTNFETALTRMFVVKNHNDRRDEILIQDSLHVLHLVSNKGEILWSKPMEDNIIGDVEQIDFFKNGKLQYFFIAGSTLYLIDRLGNFVDPYPIQTSIKDIDFASVVDYDHSKKYRFLISTKSGELWMFDKEGHNLEGWTPNKVSGELAVPPQHHRLKGKDYILALQRDGYLYLFNRRGEKIKNFPVDLNGRPSGNYFVEHGNNLTSTFFVIVNRDGFKIKINPEGKIQSRETLVKESPNAQFSLVADDNRNAYVVARQESKILVLSDENEKQVLINNFVGLNPINIQYLNFGAGNIFYLVTDLSQNLTFIYDKAGNLLTTPPVECMGAGLRKDGSGGFRIYSLYHKSLSMQALH